MNNAQLINQTSGKVEFYTPSAIIEAARLLMGNIDLDPASSEQANKTVQAKRFISEQGDGLSQVWEGNIFLNHPFGRESNPLWINKLISEWEKGHVKQACCITFACTSEKWFRPLMDFPQCYLQPRTNYYLPDGSLLKGVTKGSVVTYLGTYLNDSTVRFYHNFRKLGRVMTPVGTKVAA